MATNRIDDPWNAYAVNVPPYTGDDDPTAGHLFSGWERGPLWRAGGRASIDAATAYELGGTQEIESYDVDNTAMCNMMLRDVQAALRDLQGFTVGLQACRLNPDCWNNKEARETMEGYFNQHKQQYESALRIWEQNCPQKDDNQ